MGIYELLVVNDRLREMIVQRRPLDDLRRAAREDGMTDLAHAAWSLAAEGTTSTAEVARVIGAESA